MPKHDLKDFFRHASEWKQRLRRLDPTIQVDEASFEETVESLEKALEQYGSRLLLETSVQPDQLDISLLPYTADLVIYDGRLAQRPFSKSGLVTSDDYVFWEFGDKSAPDIFLNAVAANKHIAFLGQHTTLPEILKKDAAFLEKLSAVHDPGYRELLRQNKFNFYRSCNVEVREGRLLIDGNDAAQALISPHLPGKVQSAYEIIQKSRKDASFDHAALKGAIEYLMRQMSDGKKVNEDGVLITEKLSFGSDPLLPGSELTLSAVWLCAERKDIEHPVAAYQKVIDLSISLQKAEFLNVHQLLGKDPDLLEKAAELRKYRSYLDQQTLDRVNTAVIADIGEKRSAFERSRIGPRRYANVEDNRMYAAGIVATIQQCYEAIQDAKKTPFTLDHSQRERRERMKYGRERALQDRFCNFVFESLSQQDWADDFHKLAKGLRYGKYSASKDRNSQWYNFCWYTSLCLDAPVVNSSGFCHLVSGRQQEYATPDKVFSMLQQHNTEAKYRPVAQQFEALLNKCLLDYYNPDFKASPEQLPSPSQ